MREYILSIRSALGALVAALRSKAQGRTTTNVSASESTDGLSSQAPSTAQVEPRSMHEVECVRAYFRQIGLILRYKRFLKPGEPVSPHLRKALEVFANAEREYAACGFRPVLPLHQMYEMTEDPAQLFALGYVARRHEGEEPVYFARALARRIKKLAAQEATVVS